jgi:hypothetical protein
MGQPQQAQGNEQDAGRGQPQHDLRAPVLAVAGVLAHQQKYDRVSRERREEERDFGEDGACHYS